MIKDVLVNVSPVSGRDSAVDYAISVAEKFNAHLAGIAIAYELELPMVMGIGDMMPPIWIEEQIAKSQEQARSALNRFEDMARRAGLSVESRMLTASTASGSDQFGQLARSFDLSIARQAEQDSQRPVYEDLVIEAALFESGRPLLVVPYVHKDALRLDRVMICWDGSRHAARAVADALPLLSHAQDVEIVTVAAQDKSEEIPGAEIAAHLARHDMKIAVELIVAPDEDVANVILSHAADKSINLLVMGGYGHSRLREFILGGATREILSKMTVPTLMSH